MVFVDSNIWISYLNKNDKFHVRSLRALASIRQSSVIYITSGIVYETVNYLFKLSGKKIAESCLDFFLTSPQIEIILPTEDTWTKTINLFRKYELSLTDAQIVACMQEKDDKEIYSFDRHFDEIKGIKRIIK